MRLLLDTAVLIFVMAAPERISKRASTTLRNPGNILELSAVSLSEIAIKAAAGKLACPAETVKQALQDLDIRVLPYTAEHAFELFSLALHHKDPFDRQIIAQCLCEQLPVVTPDETFRLYAGLRVLW